MSEPGDDYLWDGSGLADPILDYCERHGAELGYDARVAARAASRWAPPPKPSRRWALPAAVAAASFLVALGWALARSGGPASASDPGTRAPVVSLPTVPERTPAMQATPPPTATADAIRPPTATTEATPTPTSSVVAPCSAAEGCEPPPQPTSSVAPQAVEPEDPAPSPRSPRRKRGASAPPDPVDPPITNASDARVELFDRDLRICFENEARIIPGLHGSGVVAFVVGPRGGVTQAEIERSNFSEVEAGSRIGACITERVQQWRFPAPTEPPMHVHLPFSFK